MLIKYRDAGKKENGLQCTVWEYDFYEHSQVGLSCAKIDGRYPEMGVVVNTACDLIYYVVSGRCHICIDNVKTYDLGARDAFYLEKNKEYFVVGDDALIVLVESPRWTLEQAKRVLG